MRRCWASGGSSSANPGHIERCPEREIRISSSHFTMGTKLGRRCLPESQSTPASSQKICENHTLERTANQPGRIVLAMDCVLAEAQWRSCQAAQLSR